MDADFSHNPAHLSQFVREIEDGAPLVVTDAMGVRHSLVLRAFATNAASRVARRR